MRPMGSIALIAFLLTGSALAGKADKPGKIDRELIGIWSGPFGSTFEVQADGTCSIMGQQGTCATVGGKLSYTSYGQSVEYRYTIQAGSLIVNDPSQPEPFVLQRMQNQPAAPTQAAPQPALQYGRQAVPQHAPQSPPPTTEPLTKPDKSGRAEVATAPSGKGSAFSKESWGVSLTVPPGWRGAEKDGMFLMGGESEAGLIIVRFIPKITREAMLIEYRRGLQEGGMNLMPMSPAQDYRAPGAKGVAGELSGMGPDGGQYRGRAIGLLSRFGGGLVIFGLTSAERYPTLKARSESVAQSVRFTEPKMPKGAEVLAGRYEYIYVSPTGGYSRQSKVTLCSDGRFSKGGEMAGSGKFGSEAPTNWGAATSHDNHGTWSSQGDALAGTITLTYGNGQSETLEYRVSQDPKDRSAYGSGVIIGSTRYQKTGPGTCN